MNAIVWLFGLAQPAIFIVVAAAGYVPPTDAWTEYGILGSIAGAEMLGLIWLVRKWTGYMESQAVQSIKAATQQATAFETLTKAVEKMAEAAHVTTEDRIRAEERLANLVSAMDRSFNACPLRR